MGHHPTKIATCCYCGTRAALVLRGDTRHELSCSACGAPLHDLKMLRADRVGGPEAKAPRPPRPGKPVRAAKPRKKKKMRKPLWSRVLGEAFDVIEDIFD